MKHQLDRIEENQGRILRLLSALLKQENTIMATLADLQAEVDAETTVNQSAITLLHGLSEQIAALKGDPAKLQALSDQLKANAQALSAAVVANTPAAATP